MAMKTSMNPYHLSHNSVVSIGHKDRTKVNWAKVSSGGEGEDAGIYHLRTW